MTMKMDSKMVLILLSFMVAVTHYADSQSMAGGDEENRVESGDRLTIVVGDRRTADSDDRELATGTTIAPTGTTAAATADRSGRQLYQPFYAYQPQQLPQRRAYRGPKKRPGPRTKPGRRPRPPRRRPSGPPPAGRYRRLPGPVRAQQVNYVDADYYEENDDGVFEPSGHHQLHSSVAAMPVMSAMSASPYADYAEREFDREPYAVVPAASPLLTAGRSRKRPPPALGGYVAAATDEPQMVHVPLVRVVRPALVQATTTADPMDKLRQLVHEAMDEHFANRHQDLYTADGTFDGKQQQQQQQQRPHVYSAKYKRQPAAADRDRQPEQRTADAVRSAGVVVTAAATAAAPVNNNNNNNKDYASSDAVADGSDDRLTLAEISAYMGAKPAETVLSAGGHRYVLSDALQQSYRHQQQQEQQQLQLHFGGDEPHHQHQYLRYVTPFEAMYELPAARWTYK